MIGTVPMRALAPLDYRYALDAARTLFEPQAAPLIRCNVPELADEAAQRFPRQPNTEIADGAVWIEPLATTWAAELTSVALQLPVGAILAVIVSQPLARIVPERRMWSAQSLGMRLVGRYKLWWALRQAGFTLDATYGFHSVASIVLGQLSLQAVRWDRPDLGDRLHFLARLRYCVRGPTTALATVALLVARKKS
jgi:hypothetical protein